MYFVPVRRVLFPSSKYLYKKIIIKDTSSTWVNNARIFRYDLFSTYSTSSQTRYENRNFSTIYSKYSPVISINTHICCDKIPSVSNNYFIQPFASFHTNCLNFQDLKKDVFKDLEDKSKIEEFVEHQQKKAEKKEKDLKTSLSNESIGVNQQSKDPTSESIEVAAPKPPIMERIKHEIKHYYNGFRLLYLDIKIAARLLWQVMNGKALSRREKKQFLRTVADMFRLVPFMVFVIVPFMEFLLPFAIKFFPGMLPSTFEDVKTKESKRRASLKLKLQMAEFLQDTIEEIAVNPQTKKSEKLKAFSDFVHKVRSGEQAPTNKEILEYSKLFHDEITLENIPHAQLKALCRLLMISPIGPSNLLRLKIEFKLQELKRDDKIIRREGIESLNTEELQSACIARGMRAIGVPVDRLQQNLKQWLQLSLDEDIPASLLLLSRTLYISPTVVDQLKVTISQFPERLIDEMEVKIGAVEREAVSRQTIIDIIQHEEQQIKVEQKEIEVKKKLDELKIDKSKEDLSKEELLDVIETLSTDREELHKIKKDRNEYIEDLAEMKLVTENPKENNASRRIGNRIDVMLKKIDATLAELEKEISHMPAEKIDSDKDGIVTTQELFQVIQTLRKAPGESKTKRLLEALDIDKDGAMSLNELKMAIELLANEDLDLDAQQIAEVIALLKGTEKIYVNEQMLTKKKDNYILRLLPVIYSRKSIPYYLSYKK
nr:mitochondrial proton/calcium exchanger protein [Hydra vulgaris]